jgi:Family of unknown function (DUF5313)
MANPHRPKPNAWQYIKYSYGGQLPDTMRDWVAEDLTGKGATLRVILRMFIPAFLILVPFWFINTDLVTHISMTVPILIPFVYFSHALNKIWRRHMLRTHGIDPTLLDQKERQKNAHIHDAYIAKYGPRDPGAPGTHDI